MKNTFLFFIAIMTVSCSSHKGFKLKNLQYEDTVTLDLVVPYPNLKGKTKSSAKKYRKILLEAAVSRLYTAIFRLGDYGLKNYNPNDFGLGRNSLYSRRVPFIYKESNNQTLYYSYQNYRGDNFNYLEELSSSYGTHIWRKPLAMDKENYYIITPKRLQKIVNTKIPILNKKQFWKEINRFYANHKNSNTKTAFKSFLSRNFPGAKLHSPVSSTVEEIFSRTESFKDGMMIGSQKLTTPNTVSFAVDKNHYALWGLVLLLNSELSVTEHSKSIFRAKIKIPVKNILNKYKYTNMSDYIE